ncbi:MAG: single-stranded DNA-binding protein [Actinomycetota bacterium]|nr:single-stranded DNA-binding protein [Actinomycetota bacterium]
MATRSRQADASTAESSRPARTIEPTTASDMGQLVPGANEVRLVGRVSGPPEERVMPSGDVLVSLRLVVPREPPKAAAADRPRAAVDTIDIACWSASTRRAAMRLRVGDRAEVAGALRRRFFRAGAVALSRYEVEAQKLTRR